MQNNGISARSPPINRPTVSSEKKCKNRATEKHNKYKNRKETIMKVLYINNDGGGFANYVNIAEDTTVDKFFSEKLPGSKSEDYLIRVNRQPVPCDYVLKDGDRITLTPTKIDGAVIHRV